MTKCLGMSLTCINACISNTSAKKFGSMLIIVEFDGRYMNAFVLFFQFYI
jgi:hypothetical protein